ncbi:MAG: family 10 glycosylhydrolase [Planctomycetia bacterium]|nr:family 10 glycosylhydrolase [Planctomycetia bacterium]
MVQVLFCTAHAAAQQSSLTLRIAWGGGAERVWRGKISVSGGTLSDPQPLGLEADEPAAMWLDDQGALVVRHRSSRTYDGVDVEVHADLSAKLMISLAADGEPAGEAVAIDLKRLVSDMHSGDLDKQKNRLLVRRAPGDKLRVTVGNPSLVFAPGERLNLRVQPHLLGDDVTGRIALRAQVLSARGRHEVSASEQQLDLAAAGQPDIVAPVEFKVPTEPGAYDLLLSVAKAEPADRLLPLPSGRELLNKLGQRTDSIAERKVQFIVIGDTAAKPAIDSPEPTAELLAINPAKTWWDRVSHLPRIPGLGKDPLEHGQVERWMHPRLGPMVMLSAESTRDKAAAPIVAASLPGNNGAPATLTRVESPAAATDNENWVAYPLSVSQPGQVHILEIEYPSDVPQVMTVSILEPNAAGAVTPIGLDGGIHVPKEAAGTAPYLARYRLAFWPRSREPLLLISRGADSARSVHGRIRLLGPRKFSVAGLRLGMEPRSGLPRAVLADGTDQRLIAGYLGRPLFPENFGASEAFDAWSGGSLDDWQTFYDGGRRMLEYANHVGYNALVVSVLADGSAIFPCPQISPTPRYDTGAFFSTGQDPVRKDVLEMLLRLADQEGQSIIPLVEFTAPLPQIEAQLRRGGADATGLELIGPTGATWLEKHGAERGPAACYNPLDPRVQQAMRQVIAQLAARYGRHRSFAGVALGSSNGSCSLMPGPEWGYDNVTVGRFALETGESVPADGPSRFVQRSQALGGQQRPAWLEWRAAALHRFHQQLRDDIVAAHPGAKLLVCTGGMLQSPEIEAMLRPTLPSRFRIEELPLAVGLRPDLYHDDDAIVLLRPRLEQVPPRPENRAVQLQTNDSPELDRAFAAAAGGGNQILHEPLRSRLATFDRQSPFGPEHTFTSLFANLTSGGAEGRRRFVESLIGLDAPLLVDGGWTLTLGEEESVRPLVAAFRRLPVGPYRALTGDTQGLIGRTLTRDGSTYLCLINPTPWACRASVAVQGSQQTPNDKLPNEKLPISELGGRRSIGPPRDGRLALELEPYDLLALRLGRSDVELSQLTVTFDDSVRALLHQRILGLVTRATMLAEPKRIDVLANADFESPQRNQQDLPGWSVAGAAGAGAALDQEMRHTGASSARLASSGGVASLISNPFAAPKTGRLSFAVWVRSTQQGPAPTLRLALGGKLHGGDYYRFAVAPVGPQWEHFIFQVDNLPPAGLSDMQVRFDLMGAGQVWLDDVTVSDLTFSPNERTELSRIITRAQFLLDGGKLVDCARLLESHWPRYLEDNVVLPASELAAKPPETNRPPREAAPPPIVEQPPAALPPPPTEAALPWWKRAIPSVLR